MKEHFYSQHAGALRAELGAAVPRELMRELHRKQPLRHFAVGLRQFAILAVCTWALIRSTNPIIWIPLAMVQGFTIFNFTVLLHEVVHHTVFARRHAAVERLLGLLYAIPSGISASQFTRWHLDHHAELGSEEDDPKRHHLSPKVNARWYKLLYCTPVLFPIYFGAARRESATYPAPLRRVIGLERRAALFAHLAAIAAIWYFFGFEASLRTNIIPVFFVFPIAFTLNRLGQHYDIDPLDPAKWGTLMKGSWFWDFAFLNSNYHLEHHYFPGVPFYRLPTVQRTLTPFYEQKGMRWRTYGGLVYGWLVENHAPHTDWAGESRIPKPSSGIANPESRIVNRGSVVRR
ncbi:MAG TPA: fatty acid desaturase [Vicinamibacterales bacterium]|jgi:fatty acid desaturase